MPYLVQPPAHSIDACNPLFTYTLANPTPSEFSTLKDLQDWGWEISVRFPDDAQYLDAVQETERAIKRRRRRTRMIFGDIVGDGPRPSLQEVWEKEAMTRFTRGLHEIQEEVKEVRSHRRKAQQQSIAEAISRIPWPHEDPDDEKKKRNMTAATNSGPIYPPPNPPPNPPSQPSERTQIGVSANHCAYGIPRFTAEPKVNKQVPAPGYTPRHHVQARSGRPSSAPIHSKNFIPLLGIFSSLFNPHTRTTVSSPPSTSLLLSRSIRVDQRIQPAMTRPPSKPKSSVSAKAKAAESDKKEIGKRSGLVARYFAPPGFVKLRGHHKRKNEGKREMGNIPPLRILKKEEFKMEISGPGLMQSMVHGPELGAEAVAQAGEVGSDDDDYTMCGRGTGAPPPPLPPHSQSQDENSSAETIAGSLSSRSGYSTVSSELSHRRGARREDEAKEGGEGVNRTRRPGIHRDLRIPIPSSSSALLSPSASTSVFPRSNKITHTQPPSPTAKSKLPSSPSRLFHRPAKSKARDMETPKPEWYTTYQAAKREEMLKREKEEKSEKERLKVEEKKREREERRERERVGVEMLRREGVGVVGVGGGMGLGIGMGMGGGL